ncbi:MAG: MFS transporter [Promethearchaeota archaeon]
MSKQKNKFNLKFTFLLSFAIFAQEIMWNFYDSQVPVSLSNYIASGALIGLIMGLDNLLGLFLEPIIGNISDKLRTRIGRRMPIIIIGMPFSVIFFILIPFETSLIMLMLFILGYVSVTLIVKAPAESLVPDFVIKKHRSKANSIIKVMTSVSIIISALISALVVDISLVLGFLIPGIISIVALIILVLTVKEKDSYVYKGIIEEGEIKEKREHQSQYPSLMTTFKSILKKDNKNTLYVLLAVLFVGIGWSSLRALSTLFGMEVLGLSRGNAGSLTLYGGIAFLIVALPIGYLSEGVRRIRIAKIGFLLFTLSFLIAFLIPTLLGVIIAIILISSFWAMININLIVIIWGFAPSKEVSGTYTGLFYLFWYLAAAFGPSLVGLFIDLTDMGFLFLNCAIFAFIGFIFILLVKMEESKLQED